MITHDYRQRELEDLTVEERKLGSKTTGKGIGIRTLKGVWETSGEIEGKNEH